MARCNDDKKMKNRIKRVVKDEKMTERCCMPWYGQFGLQWTYG